MPRIYIQFETKQSKAKFNAAGYSQSQIITQLVGGQGTCQFEHSLGGQFRLSVWITEIYSITILNQCVPNASLCSVTF